MLNRRIIWLAILMSTLLYGLALWISVGSSPAALKAHLLLPLTLILYAVALGLYVAAFVIPSVIPTRSPGAAEIIRFALLDAVCIQGLIAAFVIHDSRLYLAPWLLAMIGMLRSFPRD